MKSVIGYIVAAIVLAFLGGVLLTASRLDRSLAESQENLVTQKYAESLATFDTAERYYPAFQFVVWAGKSAGEALEAVLLETVGEA